MKKLFYYKLRLQTCSCQSISNERFLRNNTPAEGEWFDPDCCNASGERRYILNTL